MVILKISKVKGNPQRQCKKSRDIQNGQRSYQKAESYQKGQRLLRRLRVTEILKVMRGVKIR